MPAHRSPGRRRAVGPKSQGKKSGYRPGHGDHWWRLGFPSARIRPVRGRWLPATLRRWQLVHAGRLSGGERLLSSGHAWLRSAAGAAGSVHRSAGSPWRPEAGPAGRGRSGRADTGSPGRRDSAVPAGGQSPPSAAVLPLHAHVLDVRAAGARHSRTWPGILACGGSAPALPAGVRGRDRLDSGRVSQLRGAGGTEGLRWRSFPSAPPWGPRR